MKKLNIRTLYKLTGIIAGLCIITMYSFPLYIGLLNLGNMFGMSFGALLILITICFEKIKILWKNKTGKKIISVILVLAILFFTAFGITLKSITDSSKYTATDEKVVLVLGCKVAGTKPSKALYTRTAQAGKYLQKHEDAVAILCGGQGPDEGISEAQCMFNILTEKFGIDKSRLHMEDTSTNTDENIRNSIKIMEKYGYSKDVAISTSSYHLKRASMIAKKYGLNASSIPANSDKYSIPTYFTREVFGVWWQTIKG